MEILPVQGGGHKLENSFICSLTLASALSQGLPTFLIKLVVQPVFKGYRLHREPFQYKVR